MKRFELHLALVLAFLVSHAANAQISVGPLGVGPLTFSTKPAVSEFSTTVLNGGDKTFGAPPTLDAAVIAVDISTYSPAFTPFPVTISMPPATASQGFRYNTNSTGFIQSRPHSDATNAANVLLARLRNDSGTNHPSVVLSYDQSLAGIEPNIGFDEVIGFRVFYSFTGTAGSWQSIPSLSGTEYQGTLSARLSLGSWNVGDPLFLIWADDNDDGQGDFRVGYDAPLAPILVGTNGVGPLTFSTNPIVSEFATTVLNGVDMTFSTVEHIDAVVAQLNVHTYSPAFRRLPTSATIPPSSYAGGFVYNNNAAQGLFLQSCPNTSGTNAANVMVATLQNASGSAMDRLDVSYDFYDYSPNPWQHLPGFYVYFSLSGEAGTWQVIPSLTGDEASGVKRATIDLGNWPLGARLYLLWVDDNNRDGDPAYTIDNFWTGPRTPLPVILRQPGHTTNLVGRTVSVSVASQGVGLEFQWHKVGFGPISAAENPSAATSTLVITNAQLNDNGDYFVVVTNPGGSVSSLNAHIEINPDLYPPKLLAAAPSNLGSNVFNLVVDEPLCTDTVACGANATCTYNWQIVPIVDGSEGFDLVVEEVWIDGTNLLFRTSTSHQAGHQYRIKVVGGCDGGINDVFGNQLVAGEPGSTIDVPFPLPRLSIAASGSNAVVSWPADSRWVLQRANAVNGPYATVNPTSGFGVHTNVTAGNATNLFFRLRYQPEP